MVGLLIMIGLAVVGGIWQHRGMRTPLYGAFTYTALAIVLLAAGILGAALTKTADGFVWVHWTPGVVWPEIGWGLALLAPAAYLWYRGLGHKFTRPQ
jgi:hypothetical protein